MDEKDIRELVGAFAKNPTQEGVFEVRRTLTSCDPFFARDLLLELDLKTSKLILDLPTFTTLRKALFPHAFKEVACNVTL